MLPGSIFDTSSSTNVESVNARNPHTGGYFSRPVSYPQVSFWLPLPSEIVSKYLVISWYLHREASHRNQLKRVLIISFTYAIHHGRVRQLGKILVAMLGATATDHKSARVESSRKVHQCDKLLEMTIATFSFIFFVESNCRCKSRSCSNLFVPLLGWSSVPVVV